MSLEECCGANKRRFCYFEQLAHRWHRQGRGKKSGDWEKNILRSSENPVSTLSFPVSYQRPDLEPVFFFWFLPKSPDLRLVKLLVLPRGPGRERDSDPDSQVKLLIPKIVARFARPKLTHFDSSFEVLDGFSIFIGVQFFIFY